MGEPLSSFIELVGAAGRLGRKKGAAQAGAPAQAEADAAERRTAVRFPIEQEVRYKVFNRNTIELGSGRTINMSSNGVLFTTERTLSPGERLEVAVNWPAHLDNHCPLKLVTTGRIVRSDNGRAALSIERYEFRTQGINRLF